MNKNIVEEVYLNYSNIFESLYNKDKYKYINYDEFKNIVLSTINKFIKLKEKEDFIETIEKEALLVIDKRNSKRKEKMTILLECCDSELTETTDTNKILNELKKLNYVITIKNIILDDNIIEKLLIENNRLKSHIEKIINIKKENNVFKNQYKILEIIDEYCIINGINYTPHIPENKENSNIVADYIKSISIYPLLSRQDEKRLIEEYKLTGDKKIKNQIINSNLKLVIFVMKNYMNRGLPVMDLISEGNLGLMKALEKYDITKENKFSTCAFYWIRHSISRAIENQSKIIRVPSYQQANANKIKNASIKLTQELNREPTVEEIAEELNISKEDVIKTTTHASIEAVSLDEEVEIKSTTSDKNLLDYIKDDTVDVEKRIEEKILENEIDILLKNSGLSEKYIKVIKMRFGLGGKIPMTYEAIGKEFNVARQRIEQITVRALDKIRKNRDKKEFLLYLNIQNKKRKKHSFRNVELASIYTQIRKEDENATDEEISAFLNRLDDDLKEKLYKKYGTDLKNPVNMHNNKNSNIISKIKREYKKYKNPKSEKTQANSIYNILLNTKPKITEDEIEFFIETLESDLLEKLHNRYGKDLKNPDYPVYMNKKESMHFNSTVVQKIKRKFKNFKLGKVQGIKSIYEILSNRVPTATEEIIDEFIKTLDQNTMDILHKRYGENLKEITGNKKTTVQETREFHDKTVPQLEIALKDYINPNRRVRAKSIYKVLQDMYYVSDEEIDIFLNTLDENLMNIIYNRYGTDLKNCNTIKKLSDSELYKFRGVISKVKMEYRTWFFKRRKQRKNQEKTINEDINYDTKRKENITKTTNTNKKVDLGETAQYILELRKTDAFEKLLENFTYKEVVVIILKYGVIDNKKYEDALISRFININKEEINDIINKSNRLNIEETIDLIKRESIKITSNESNEINNVYQKVSM